jgi:hypothetical protein
LQGPFADGTTWTFSCFAKSSVAKSLTLFIAFSQGVGGAMQRTVVNNVVIGNLQTSYTRFTHTFTVPAGASVSTSTSLQVTPYVTGAGTANYFITGVQLEAGPVATPFRRNANSLQGELAACQRYYQEIGATAYFAVGTANNTTEVTFSIPLTTTMRTAPSFAFSATGDFVLVPGSIAITNLIQGTSTTSHLSFYSQSAAVLTATQARTLFGNTANARLRLSSEL